METGAAPKGKETQTDILPLVSVLVRTRNEALALPFFWEALRRQTIFHRTEVLVLDSGSTDDTLQFLRGTSAAVHLLSGEFNFGKSCNQLAELATSRILIYLSAHVFLQQNNTLEELASYLEKRPHCAAYLRQIPNTILGCSAYERAYLARRYPHGDYAVRLRAPDGFSNAASAISKEAWERRPFPEMHGSEDYAWAMKHLSAGGELFYLPYLEAMHSHNENPGQVYNRVKLNVEARGMAGSRGRAAYLFAGIYWTMRRAGAPHDEALRYAVAHSRAYL